MYTRLYDLLEPKVGQNAAKKALDLQYANLGLLITGILVIALSYTGNEKTWVGIAILLMLLLAAVGVNVYFRIKFTEALSEHFKGKVRWFELPNFTPVSRFESWLESLGERTKD